MPQNSNKNEGGKFQLSPSTFGMCLYSNMRQQNSSNFTFTVVHDYKYSDLPVLHFHFYTVRFSFSNQIQSRMEPS